MTLATDALTDIDTMLAGWGDTITIAGVSYDGMYSYEYVELSRASGNMPVFTAKTSDVSAVSADASVTVTSPLAGISNQAFTVMLTQNLGDGLTKLLLQEA